MNIQKSVGLKFSNAVVGDTFWYYPLGLVTLYRWCTTVPDKFWVTADEVSGKLISKSGYPHTDGINAIVVHADGMMCSHQVLFPAKIHYKSGDRIVTHQCVCGEERSYVLVDAK
jgi:hypothetical protein